jgi:hypothetical protein
MTSYGLEYTDDADNQLADLWLASTDRNGVTRAQRQIDLLLSSDPQSGQYLSEGLWKAVVSPLAAFYEFDDASRQVTVTDFDLF